MQLYVDMQHNYVKILDSYDVYMSLQLCYVPTCRLGACQHNIACWYNLFCIFGFYISLDNILLIWRCQQ